MWRNIRNSDRVGTQLVVDVFDLYLKKLDEFHEQLQELQKEKIAQGKAISHTRSISITTLATLAKTVVALKEDKKERLQKLQELATQLTDLWNLMDTSEGQSLFDHVTCNISASVDEVNVPGALADLIEQAGTEVERLDQLKSSKMKEIDFKWQGELEEIFARAHIEIDTQAAREKILALIDSGNVEPTVKLS